MRCIEIQFPNKTLREPYVDKRLAHYLNQPSVLVLVPETPLFGLLQELMAEDTWSARFTLKAMLIDKSSAHLEIGHSLLPKGHEFMVVSGDNLCAASEVAVALSKHLAELKGEAQSLVEHFERQLGVRQKELQDLKTITAQLLAEAAPVTNPVTATVDQPVAP